MTIASEITRLTEAKAEIKASIEGKGVSVPAETKLDAYPALIDQITGGGGDPYVPWTPHPDWPDIENPTANETWLIFGSNGSTGYMVPEFSGAIGTVDYGDGTVKTTTQLTRYKHVYTPGTGVLIDGTYEVWVIKVISRTLVFTLALGGVGILYIVNNYATQTITSSNDQIGSWNLQYIKTKRYAKITLYGNDFLRGIESSEASWNAAYSIKIDSKSLEKIIIPSLPVGTFLQIRSLTSLKEFQLETATLADLESNFQQDLYFNATSNDGYLLAPNIKILRTKNLSYFVSDACVNIEEIIVPSNGTTSSIGSSVPVGQAFSACNLALRKATIAEQSNTTARAFNSFINLEEVTVLTPLPVVSFSKNPKLTKITFATTTNRTGTYTSPKIVNNPILETIENTTSLGCVSGNTTTTDFNGFLNYCTNLTSPITLQYRVNKLTIQNCYSLTSIRLTYAGTDGFTGTSPQVDVSTCALGATALNLLFGDLPTMTGKTIKITGNPGAATCDPTIATAKGWTVTI